MFVEHPLIKPQKIEARLYQESIFSSASEKNTLVVLPTGLGKTAIALLLAAKRLSLGRIIMLAPTKPLVTQHTKTFQDNLCAEVCEISGTIPVEKRKELWLSKVICATPQVLFNDLMRAVDISDVSLIIFDEAHRAVGNYAYGFIAETYMKKAKNPLILGLTASPGSEKEKIQEVCRNLFIENIEAREHHDPDVVSYVKPVQIEWQKVELPPELNEIRDLLRECLREPVRELKKEGVMLSSNLNFIKKRDLLMIQAKAHREQKYQAISHAASAIKVLHALELIETQGVKALVKYLDKLRRDDSKAAKRVLDTYYFAKILEKLKVVLGKDIEHPKLALLKQLVTRRCIVFSHYQEQARLLVEILRSEGHKAELLVGRTGMTQKKQKEIVEKFRSGETEILVATSVGEEGLDIPVVDLVIFYEPVPSAIRSIQRKGRTARHSAGKVIILVTKGTRDEAYLYISEHKERNMMQNLKDAKPTQRTLGAFDEEHGKTTVLVDSREAGSEVIAELGKLVEVRLVQLPVADYVCSDRVAVERKTDSDFVNSIIDKRLFEQLINLKEHYETPILLIEGTNLYSQRSVHPNAIRGAMAAAAVDLKLPIIFSSGPRDTAEIIAMIARREQEEKKRYPALVNKRKAATIPDRQLRLVANLPSVGDLLAVRLLEQFGSPEKIFTAPEAELSKVEKIGKVKAETIRKILTSKWGSNDSEQTG